MGGNGAEEGGKEQQGAKELHLVVMSRIGLVSLWLIAIGVSAIEHISPCLSATCKRWRDTDGKPIEAYGEQLNTPPYDHTPRASPY